MLHQHWWLLINQRTEAQTTAGQRTARTELTREGKKSRQRSCRAATPMMMMMMMMVLEGTQAVAAEPGVPSTWWLWHGL